MPKLIFLYFSIGYVFFSRSHPLPFGFVIASPRQFVTIFVTAFCCQPFLKKLLFASRFISDYVRSGTATDGTAK
jgi:hypothetical protein